jgi:Flp pilus assembly protein TadG
LLKFENEFSCVTSGNCVARFAKVIPKMKRHYPNTTTTRQTRRGVAATEFAVCLALIMILLLGTLEASTMIFLKQSLSL